MNFYALRVSLVAMEPQLFVNKNMSEDIYAFEDALRYSEHSPPENEHNEKLFSLKIMIDGRDEGVMAGMVAKAKSLHGHDANFNEYSVDDFPPMVWLWDREQQVILVEKKTNVFSTPTAACKAFQSLANNIELAEINLRADITPVLNSTVHTFWEEYDRFESVQTVTFDLIPPNLFGNTEKEMKKALCDTTENTNANVIRTTFENKDSTLKLKSEGWLNNMVRWCRKGGGEWTLKGRLAGHKKKLTSVGSERVAKIVAMSGKGVTEIELSNYSAGDVVEVLSLYREKYDYHDEVLEENKDV
ncbi:MULTISPECIES: hypothetical protein [Vibrio]|uniref:Uncharacterized protein n=1 Tax=Vibrio atlanticus TaxID=693153 RepID=A0A1C3J3L1_9VIBR|nr:MULTISPECIES: hypothetical protein [Vibrio]ROO64550.1 hypothetical protein EDB58_102443 [Vibrio crassostreae]CAK3526225.1 Recombination-associated protein RdgC [Vibrio crassostreae]CAK3656924.1 Recombination-associated protein RdgC [Vibrio crassostreae]SBS68230.1 hypothetical protein VAT7223_04103 [Vibrio atlanticus]